MSSKLSSPTAQLLRSSRLFSLPAALPQATGSFADVPRSDSATRPYPVQQAIVTTPSGLARGDWGLKRPLPLKATTRSSTPTVRINAVDTFEHITDFESAADLTVALQRIQELNLPVTQPISTGRVRTSVFESSTDNTDPAVVESASIRSSEPADHFGGFGIQSAEDSRKTMSRWKHRGPWVAGMTKGEFGAYVNNELRSRRHEFMNYLRQRFVEEANIEHRRKARLQRGSFKDDNQTEGQASQEPAIDTSDAAFAAYVKKLRGNYNINTTLAKYVSDFLDLPSAGGQDELGIGSLIGEQQTAPCHPSAGLSYLRSDSHINNHPILGPRAGSTPAEGRVLVPLRGVYKSNSQPDLTISVAGVASKLLYRYDGGKWLPSNTSVLETGTKSSYDRKQERHQTRRLGVDVPGGHRGWMEPSYMGIDARGRIDMKVVTADANAAASHTGELIEDIRAEAQRKRPIATPLFNIPDRPSVRRAKSNSRDQESSDGGAASSNAAYRLVRNLAGDSNSRDSSPRTVGQ